MKKIKYSFVSAEIRGEKILLEKSMLWSEANEEIAKKEAHNGEYIIEDDGQPEPDTTTADDVLNALLGVSV